MVVAGLLVPLLPGAGQAVERAVLIYDGECALCRASALWLMRRARMPDRLEILPCRSRPRRERYPHITEEACMSAMQLVLPDGRVLSGADAVPELLRRVRGLALGGLASSACRRCVP